MFHPRPLTITRVMATVLLVAQCVAVRAQQFSAADTTVCKAYADSVGMYAQRYDAVDTMLHHAARLLDCSRATGDLEGQAMAQSVLGVGHFRKSDYAAAMRHYREAERVSLLDGDSSSVAKVRINIGNTYMKQDSLEQGLRALLSATEMLEALKDSAYLAFVYNSIAGTMGLVGNVNERLRYSQLAFGYYGRKLSDPIGLGIAANLTHHLEQANLLDSAETLGLRVLEASRKLGVKKTEAQVANYLSVVAFRTDRFDVAVERCRQVLAFEGTLTMDWLFNDAYSYLGQALMKLGRNREALEAMEKGLRYAHADKSSRAFLLSYASMHGLYASEGRFKEAYEHLQLYSTLRDSLDRTENAAVINELQTKYETAKKEQAIRDLDQQNRINELKVRQRTILGLLVALVMLVFVALVYFRSRQRELKQERIALDNRLRSLRVQMNPHFIFNALSAIQNYLISGKDMRESTRYLSNFAKVMRAFLEYNQQELITLDKEVDALELYLGIQKLRFDNGFTHEIDIDPELEPEVTQVPPMLLQPFVENAIEHGIRNVENGHIRLSYRMEGDELVMEVTDNGVGRSRSAIDRPKAEGKTSLATSITEERIALLNRNGKGRHRFEVADANPDGSGTSVTFHIPLQWA
jgi:tetratricopeptide (TPR) repeat protein